MEGEDDDDLADHPTREQTDESLREERTQTDAAVAEKRAVVEAKEDQVVRTARRLADDVVEEARTDADLDHPPSAAAAVELDRARDQADQVLEAERAREDASLHEERTERSSYLAEFLAVEREATDADLVREREYSDSRVSTRDEFLSTVSHDMRNLLGGLGINASLLLKHAPGGPGGDGVRRHAAASQRLVARMTRLVNDLLDVSSIDAGKLAVQVERVEIGKILRDTLEAFEPVALAKGVSLDGEAADMAFVADLDGGRVLQVLANLVSNAIKFTSAGGRISIHVRTEKDSVHFEVTDTGIGIREEDLGAIFERFRQISRDRRGLGLGLHISKCIVEAHGGRMWVESKLGLGSSFHVALPAARTAGATARE